MTATRPNVETNTQGLDATYQREATSCTLALARRRTHDETYRRMTSCRLLGDRVSSSLGARPRAAEPSSTFSMPTKRREA